MKRKIIFILLCSVCIVLPAAAQTVAPEGMVLIPAGKFWMGRAFSIFLDSGDLVARDKLDDRPANNIYLDAFYIDKYEVTNADYARFLEAKGGRPPWHWPEGQIPKGEEKYPVANVNWYEATDYCQWVGKRLPTEAEWEKAARGGLDRAHYAWGDDTIDRYNELGLLSPQVALRDSAAPPVPATLGRPRPNAVASFAPNGYGLYDMIGNVMEWTNDWYDNNYYPFIPKQNPRGPETGRYKSVRGAGYADQGGHGMEKLVSYRNFSDPDTRMTTIGFRCAK
jgi:formylglycine-generating enzyme required for sulfatase activity